jgi:hypothetical protein
LRSILWDRSPCPAQSRVLCGAQSPTSGSGERSEGEGGAQSKDSWQKNRTLATNGSLPVAQQVQ